jgi:peptidoglycan/xylan/chitin deacetylase (PgdA/CDA1 family)
MNVLLTIDVEAHRTKDEFGHHNGSLDIILKILKKHNLKATFFVDYCSIKKWGYNEIEKVVRKIEEQSHNIQLHAHPHHYFKNNDWLLKDYKLSDQRECIKYCYDKHLTLTKSVPIAFRTGGFAANLDTIKILQECKILFDSSLLNNHKNCNLPAENKIRELGVNEIGLSKVYTIPKNKFIKRCSSIDFNWIPIYILRKILTNHKNDQYSVILMHSSSMCIRQKSDVFVINAKLVKKFENLCEFVAANARLLTFDRLDLPVLSKLKMAQSYYLKNPIDVIYCLYYQSKIGAGFSYKFFTVLLLFRLSTIGIIILVLWALL